IYLETWYRGAYRKMPFGVPRPWRDHTIDCCFCVIDLSRYKKPQDRKKIKYPLLESTRAPISHSVPLPPCSSTGTTKEEILNVANETQSDKDKVDYKSSEERHLLLVTRTDLNDLVRALNLLIEKAKLLGSRLSQ
ncbi:hypothetical protein ILUMI_03761, partial [Ignelater luminosus]